ncbi:MAG: hypothetical protein V4808_06910, partial [Pseudomonadota bacterium]
MADRKHRAVTERPDAVARGYNHPRNDRHGSAETDMCGIAGFVRLSGFEAEQASQILRAMTDAIAHRGPDDSGEWLSPDAGVAFGHRRLAVVDLSKAGHQPMRSACGRYVLIFNGEIYNHQEMRAEIGAQAWRGHSDTETLLAGISAWGLEKALRKCVGMFALALWDIQERRLSLARDRIGEKPLYYGWNKGVFLFGSELKALRAYTGFGAAIDRQALELLARQGYISGAQTIFQGISRVPPGAIVELRLNKGDTASATVEYWNLRDAALAGAAALALALGGHLAAGRAGALAGAAALRVGLALALAVAGARALA